MTECKTCSNYNLIWPNPCCLVCKKNKNDDYRKKDYYSCCSMKKEVSK